MPETIITWNFSNLVTVGLMAFLLYVLAVGVKRMVETNNGANA